MQNRELNTCKHDIYSFLRFSLPTNTEPCKVRRFFASAGGGQGFAAGPQVCPRPADRGRRANRTRNPKRQNRRNRSGRENRLRQ